MAGIAPDRIVLRVLRVGVAAIKANPAVLDHIWSGFEPGELTKLKAFFSTNPPHVAQGYPRTGGPYPAVLVTLLSDSDNAEYLGESDMAILDDDDLVVGNERARRRTETVGIWVIGQNYDVMSAYYRVTKRILEVATDYMVGQGLDLTKLTGADLVPDAQTETEQLFVRRLSLTVEYVDDWPVDDALWIAINGDPESTGTKVDAFGLDVAFTDGDDDQFGGGAGVGLLEDP